MNSRIILFLVLVGMIAASFYFDLGQYLNLENIKAEQAALAEQVKQQPVLAVAIYFVIYVVVIALSLPVAVFLTLIGGAIFGFGWGLLIVSFTSTIGATLAMIVSRFLLRDFVTARFGDYVAKINKGIEKEGAFYLFTMRLVPAFPFFAVNLAMGLTKMTVPVFFIVSQVGMLAGTAVYVNAGTQLAQIETLSGILSPGLLGSFVLLGVVPLVAKRLLEAYKARSAA